MRRFVPILLACCLIPGAHAAPETSTPAAKAIVQVKITEVDWSTDLPAWSSPANRPQTGVPDELRDLQKTYALVKMTLPLMPGPVVTTQDGAPGAISARTKVTAGGPTPRAFQVIGNGLTALPHLNADGTVTAQIGVVAVQVAGPFTTTAGVVPIIAHHLDTTWMFQNGETKCLGRLDLNGRMSRLVFATVTLVPPAKP